MDSIQELYQFFERNHFAYSTDSRKISPNDVFFCLTGEKFDANVFAEDAKQQGAGIVVTNREDLRTAEGFFFSENPLHSFQQLAKIHALKMDAKIVIIGGSNGKTTTKELVHSVLSKFGSTHTTAGNFNNHVGVPITLLGIRPNHEYAVVEMGTNHPGEMKILCDLVYPEIGIITNIGKEHLEGFGDIEAVAKEESEVFLKLIECSGTGVVNLDDSWISSMSIRLNKSIGISIDRSIVVSGKAKFSPEIIREMPKLIMKFQGPNLINGEREFSIAGSYNAYNILFALAIGDYFGFDLETCLNEMQTYSPKNNRSEWREIGTTKVFLDAYNANPSSMNAAIRSFHTLEGEKSYFIGDMLELGSHSELEHQQILNLIQELGIADSSYLVGNEFYRYCSQFPMRFSDTESLLAWLDTHPVKSDYVFVKGSRGIKMENVLDHFKS